MAPELAGCLWGRGPGVLKLSHSQPFLPILRFLGMDSLGRWFLGASSPPCGPPELLSPPEAVTTVLVERSPGPRRFADTLSAAQEGAPWPCH